MTKTELLKTAKPILFNTEMVRAILDGRKTVTRRVVKPQPNGTFDRHWECFTAEDGEVIVLSDLYHPGDILYVRETWQLFGCSGCEGDEQGRCMYPERRIESKDGCYVYKATDDVWEDGGMKWHPSIHMPKEAARIFLRVTDVRVERLQEITPKQAGAEGVEWETDNSGLFRKFQFQKLWDNTIKPTDREKYGWDANPWVWVIEFERVGAQG